MFTMHYTAVWPHVFHFFDDIGSEFSTIIGLEDMRSTN